MQTVFEALASSVGYPVPKGTIEAIAMKRGIYNSLQEEINPQVMSGKAYALCEADMMKYLVTVANVSEGDVSISMSDKDILINTANSVYSAYGEPLIGVPLRPTVENLSDE
ncbi:hypothetical protein [Alistipes timonensis]|uniref:hypothetical protein n=1 Tax=Alistipes timonensis TaxID=1465754 RepID=UPI00266BD9E7|nr:hypothetical protein [Alistipes timonensis]